MTKEYDVEFKKQLVHAYSEWVKKCSEECKYTFKSQSDNLYAKVKLVTVE